MVGKSYQRDWSILQSEIQANFTDIWLDYSNRDDKLKFKQA